MDLFLTVGPLANVDIEGNRVPLRAISKSLDGCLQTKIRKNTKKYNKSLLKVVPSGLICFR